MAICESCNGAGCYRCLYKGRTNDRGSNGGGGNVLGYLLIGGVVIAVVANLFSVNNEDVTAPADKKLPQKEIRIKTTPPAVRRQKEDRTYTAPTRRQDAPKTQEAEPQRSRQFRTDKDVVTPPHRQTNDRYSSYDGYPVISETAINDYTGRAVCTYKNGYFYAGDFRKGSWHGQGTLRYTNGDMYEGEWKNSQRDGQGKFTFANGDYHEGKWKNNFEHGRGVYLKDGIITHGRWFKGELRQSFSVSQSYSPRP